MTEPSKLEVPVKNAYIVPSTLFGVSFANSARIGMVENAIPTAPKTMSVKNRKTISSMPHAKFHLIAKENAKKAPVIFIKTL